LYRVSVIPSKYQVVASEFRRVAGSAWNGDADE